jgi:hypothetical protein
MIIVHFAPARLVPHHPVEPSAGQAIENEQLFEHYTKTGAGAAPVGTEPTATPRRPGGLA